MGQGNGFKGRGAARPRPVATLVFVCLGLRLRGPAAQPDRRVRSLAAARLLPRSRWPFCPFASLYIS